MPNGLPTPFVAVLAHLDEPALEPDARKLGLELRERGIMPKWSGGGLVVKPEPGEGTRSELAPVLFVRPLAPKTELGAKCGCGSGGMLLTAAASDAAMSSRLVLFLKPLPLPLVGLGSPATIGCGGSEEEKPLTDGGVGEGVNWCECICIGIGEEADANSSCVWLLVLLVLCRRAGELALLRARGDGEIIIGWSCWCDW